MEGKPPRLIKVCPECNSQSLAAATKCWLCHGYLREATVLAASEPPSKESQLDPSQSRAVPTFTLSSLLLIVTLISVCLGITVYVPGLGIVLMILSIPATIRAAIIGGKYRRAGFPLSAEYKVSTFLASLAVVFAIALASVGTFFTVCFSMGFAGFSLSYSNSAFGEPLMIAGWVLGIGLGILLGIFAVKKLWRRKE